MSRCKVRDQRHPLFGVVGSFTLKLALDLLNSQGVILPAIAMVLVVISNNRNHMYTGPRIHAHGTILLSHIATSHWDAIQPLYDQTLDSNGWLVV